MLSLRGWFLSLATHSTLSCSRQRTLSSVPHQILNKTLSNSSKNLSCYCGETSKKNGFFTVASDLQSSASSTKDSPFSGTHFPFVSLQNVIFVAVAQTRVHNLLRMSKCPYVVFQVWRMPW